MQRLFRGLLFQDTFEPVTDKGTNNKDDNEDQYRDKDTEHTKEPHVTGYVPGNEVNRGEHENNAQDDTDDRAVSEDAHEVFFPTVKKAK
jgi:hypothetical protein